jgi:tropomyosin-1
MTTNIQQGTLLDVLTKKMRQIKEDMEKYKDECEEFHKRLQVEIMHWEGSCCPEPSHPVLGERPGKV